MMAAVNSLGGSVCAHVRRVGWGGGGVVGWGVAAGWVVGEVGGVVVAVVLLLPRQRQGNV